MAQMGDNLNEVITNIRSLAQTARAQGTAEAYELLEQQVERFESKLREMQQAQIAPQARQAISRLRGSGALAPEDQEVIRNLVVGDAEQYVRQERNFDEWLEELGRLSNEMGLLAEATNEDSISKLRGIVKDAVRLLPNIRSYMEEKERVKKFDAAFGSLDKANRALLVDLLEEKLNSPTR